MQPFTKSLESMENVYSTITAFSRKRQYEDNILFFLRELTGKIEGCVPVWQSLNWEQKKTQILILIRNASRLALSAQKRDEQKALNALIRDVSDYAIDKTLYLGGVYDKNPDL